MASRIELHINGMTCAHCAKGIEDHLRELGLPDARVAFSSSSASFSKQPNIALELVLVSLNKLGYKAQLLGNTPVSKSIFQSLNLLTFFCLFFSLPLIFAELIHLNFLHNPLVQLCLATPVMLSGGLYFTKSAIRSLRLKKPNMDVLIALGTWAAFAYSLVGTILHLGPDFLFYETSASIITIVLVGNLIEARAVLKTEESLTKLQKLMPDSIRRRDPNTGNIESIILDLVKKGDQIVLSPGDRIPTDAEIIEGSGELDESFLTGESLPRSVTIKDNVNSGALLIGGNLIIKANAIGEESSLVKIIRTIQSARTEKPNLERLADRLTNFFVPVVLSISILTYFLNMIFGVSSAQSLLRSIAVLVISCPCALGLATPTAVTVALGLASKLGILVRKSSIFETLSVVKYVFFDKTGTLTDGNFKVDKFESLDGDETKMKRIILGLEALSLHPIAVALRNYCSLSNSIEPQIFTSLDEQRGLGIYAQTNSGVKYELSSREVKPPYHLALRENDNIIGRIQLTDSIRKNSAALISWLKKYNFGLEILSGDNSERTNKLAAELLVDKAQSRLLPKDKADYVAKKEEEVRVAFVGDGINDAAALARASVGITFGAASDLARHSADVTIVAGGLEKVAYLMQLSKKTTSSIKQNLFWAFFYNIIFIPVAAFGLLSPMHAAFAMVLSDLIVVANSLRLKLWQPKPL